MALAEIGEAMVSLGIVSSVDHAGGPLLDMLGSLLGIERLDARVSRVTATLTGVAGVAVPAGSRAKTDPGGAAFKTVSSVVLSPAGELIQIVTLIAGWESIVNASAAVVGRTRQADASYREERLQGPDGESRHRAVSGAQRGFGRSFSGGPHNPALQRAQLAVLEAPPIVSLQVIEQGLGFPGQG